MAGLQSLLEDWRNWSSTQDWKYKKQLEEMFGGDPSLMQDFEGLAGMGTGGLSGIAGSLTRFPLDKLQPLLRRELISGKSMTPDAPILVDYDKAGNLYITDGTHRYYEALDKGLSSLLGYYSPRTGKSLSIKQEMELAPKYNQELFDVGPRLKK